MGNIKIIKGVFDTKLELEHAGVAAGFPSPADDYRHETLDFNRDYIRHPEASFYGDVEGDSMRDAGLLDGDRVIIDNRRGMVGRWLHDEIPRSDTSERRLHRTATSQP